MRIGRFLTGAGVSLLASIGAATIPAMAQAESPGFAVIVANTYDGYLPAAQRDASAVAETLEKNGFVTFRRFDAGGGEMAAALSDIRNQAADAGPVRFVYLSGFGMCLNDDLVLFAEDIQPEQFKSGQVADFSIPVSLVAAAAAGDAEQTFVVFDAIPRMCTRDMVKTVKLPEKTAMLVTTSVGGDLADEVGDSGVGVFATAFSQTYAADRPLSDVMSDVVARIDEISNGQQQPVLIDAPSSEETNEQEEGKKEEK